MDNILDLAYYKTLLKRDYSKGVEFLKTVLLNEENALELINDKNAILTIYDENDTETYKLADIVNMSKYGEQAILNYFNYSRNIIASNLDQLFTNGDIETFFQNKSLQNFTSNSIFFDLLKRYILNKDKLAALVYASNKDALLNVLSTKETYSYIKSIASTKSFSVSNSNNISVVLETIDESNKLILVLEYNLYSSLREGYLETIYNSENYIIKEKSESKLFLPIDLTKIFKLVYSSSTSHSGNSITYLKL